MDNEIILSQTLEKVLSFAEEAAPAYGSTYIGSEHIVFAMLNCPESNAYKILTAGGASERKFSEYFIRSIDRYCNIKDYTPRTKRIIETAVAIANGNTVRTDHVLFAIIQSSECLAMRIFRCIGINFTKLADGLVDSFNSNDKGGEE